MQPTIITMRELTIAGIAGDGSQTGELWESFDRQYSIAPFARLGSDAYEIRIDDGSACVCHVGFSVEEEQTPQGYAILTFPASEYAVFDVCVINGYDSENKAMDEWLADNPQGYIQSMLGGKPFVVECYNEKFKGGDQADSIVEIWIPVHKKG